MSDSRIVAVLYAPELKHGEARALSLVKSLELALGLRLDRSVSEDGATPLVPERDTWLLAGAARGAFPLVCNGDTAFPVTAFGRRLLPPGIAGALPLLSVHVQFPLEVGIAVTADALAAVGEGAAAFWGHATPARAAAELSGQVRDPALKPGPSPRGLPVLRFPTPSTSPALPLHLGWLNYWSAAAAQAIGFPDPTRDAELLTRARCTPSGGWVVPLTDRPLELDTPVHLEALRRAYERFPEIGGRSPP